ncbi:hypothetical protein SDC9_137541 [bioreactor metagenome]|uniref:Uncharacterized protein n=1 Tax=bioreactor metagenome TaxID=1076179 RepID=A0A645DLU4_9ZZZZ
MQGDAPRVGVRKIGAAVGVHAEPAAQPAHIRSAGGLGHHQVVRHHHGCTTGILQQPCAVLDALLHCPRWWRAARADQLDGAEQLHHGMLGSGDGRHSASLH